MERVSDEELKEIIDDIDNKRSGTDLRLPWIAVINGLARDLRDARKKLKESQAT